MGSGWEGAYKTLFFFLTLYDSTRSPFQGVRQPETPKPQLQGAMSASSFYLYRGFDRKTLIVPFSQKGTLRLGVFEPGQEAKKGQDRACNTGIHGKSCFWATKQSPT